MTTVPGFARTLDPGRAHSPDGARANSDCVYLPGYYSRFSTGTRLSIVRARRDSAGFPTSRVGTQNASVVGYRCWPRWVLFVLSFKIGSQAWQFTGLIRGYFSPGSELELKVSRGPCKTAKIAQELAEKTTFVNCDLGIMRLVRPPVKFRIIGLKVPCSLHNLLFTKSSFIQFWRLDCLTTHFNTLGSTSPNTKGYIAYTSILQLLLYYKINNMYHRITLLRPVHSDLLVGLPVPEPCTSETLNFFCYFGMLR